MDVHLMAWCFILELEEKNESHLKCPEDTTSISSTSVGSLFGTLGMIYVLFPLLRTVAR